MSRAISHIDTFQGLILALQNYWAEQGCVVLQPYDMEMGAGTFHTATFLRALGPETWNAAYVQPSRRPKDGRYGENPTVCNTTTSSRLCLSQTRTISSSCTWIP